MPVSGIMAHIFQAIFNTQSVTSFGSYRANSVHSISHPEHYLWLLMTLSTDTGDIADTQADDYGACSRGTG